MKQTSLSRRLLAGAAGLVIGAAGALALSAPAQAEEDAQILHKGFKKAAVEFVDDCEGTQVTVTSGKVFKSYKWTIEVDGEKVWSEWVGKMQTETHFVPAEAGDEISVDFKGSPRKGWPVTHTWTEPADCEQPEEPEEPEIPIEGNLEGQFDCDTFDLTLYNTTEEDFTLSVVPSVGDAVDVTVPAEGSADVSFPSSEGLIVDVQIEGESVLEDGVLEITSEDWAELGCDEDGGAGGEDELPVTGSSTLLIAGGALALLALGGGMFMVARRRRVTFTA